MEIGAWIKQYREKNNLSQEDFGKRVGVNKQTVSRWEKGTLRPSVNMYYEIAAAIKVPLNEILDEDYEKSNLPVFADNHILPLGLNSIYNGIRDYETLCVFLDMVIEYKRMIQPKGLIGYMNIDHDVVEQGDIEHEALPVYDYTIYDDFIDIIIPFEEIASIPIHREMVIDVTPRANFKNNLYSVNVKLRSQDEIKLIQLVIDIEENISEYK